MILRTLRPFRIYDGAPEVHRYAIAKHVCKHIFIRLFSSHVFSMQKQISSDDSYCFL